MLKPVQRRLRLREPARDGLARVFGTAFLIFGAYYLVWRVGWSLNTDALWLAIPLLAAEILGFSEFVLFLLMTWRIPPLRRTQAPPGFSVDVYITTYNESPELLRGTILGAVNMRYPHETYVLDDGRRPAVAKLAAQLGAHYITREDRSHAKAGNINHALTQTSGEYLAIFDADHVPHPQFLERTLGYFTEEGLALVQTPQEFYNLDSIQHSGDRGSSDLRWNEQALFYHVIQPGKDRFNSVFWCGSNAVIRRAALESIGGCATETITEDIHTTIKLHAAGWRTAYHNETLATGIAPDDLDAYLAQRKRWAQGAMQVLRSRWNPVWARGLSLPQRLSYWASMSTYLASFQKLVLIATPIVVLMTGILPMNAFGWDFLAHFLPYMLLGQVANSLLGRGYGRYLDTERFNLLKAFSFVRASMEIVLPRSLRFEVTRKTQLDDRSRELAAAFPHTLLLILSLGAIAWAFRQIYLVDGSAQQEFAMQLTAIWAIYNAGLIGFAVRAVLTRSHRRATYRFDASVFLSARIDAEARPPFEAVTEDINSDGLSFYHDRELLPGTSLQLTLALPGRSPVETTALVMNARPVELGQQAWRIGALFVDMDDAVRDAVTLFLFSEVAIPGVPEPQRVRAAA